MSTDSDVRPENAVDIAGIHAVHVACFPTDAEARLVDALRENGELSVSLVATDEGGVVGHVAFSPVTVNAEPGGRGLAPVAVLEKHRRQGIAARLIRAGIAKCRDQGCGYLVVLGDPSYYGRFGFVPAPTHGLQDEYGGGDAFQVLPLVDGALPRGLVRYAAAFGQLS